MLFHIKEILISKNYATEKNKGENLAIFTNFPYEYKFSFDSFPDLRDYKHI